MQQDLVQRNTGPVGGIVIGLDVNRSLSWRGLNVLPDTEPLLQAFEHVDSDLGSTIAVTENE
jgi:hypothetical protein